MRMITPNLIDLGNGQFALMTKTGQVVPIDREVAIQLYQAQQQQTSSLAPQAPKGLGGTIIDSFGGGIKKALDKQTAVDAVNGNQQESWLDKIFGSAPTNDVITHNLPTMGQAPSFSMGGPAYNTGLPESVMSAPSYADVLASQTSQVPEAGASIIPDSLPAGLTGGPGEFSLGAESGADAASALPATSGWAMKGIGSEGNYLLPAAGALGAYNLAMSQGDAASGGGRNLRGLGQGAASGAAMGSYFGPEGALIGGGIGALGGLAGSLFGSSKGGRQMTRDEWRKRLLDSGTGLFDNNYQGTLADGTNFDFGKDKFGFGTNPGDIDLSKPAVGRAAAWGNALAGITGYGGGKGKDAVATQFTAASTANLKDPNDLATVKDNYKHFLAGLGITNKDDAHRYLDASSAQGMDRNTWGQGTAAIDEIFSDKYPTGFDNNGSWVGTPSPTPAPTNNGSPGRRPKKR